MVSKSSADATASEKHHLHKKRANSELAVGEPNDGRRRTPLWTTCLLDTVSPAVHHSFSTLPRRYMYRNKEPPPHDLCSQHLWLRTLKYFICPSVEASEQSTTRRNPRLKCRCLRTVYMGTSIQL